MIPFTLEEKYDYLKNAAIFGLFLGLAAVIYRQFRISGLYMDDLYMWSCYGEQSFVEYVFPMGSTRFRPVYWFLAWIQLGIIGNRITWIVPMNILIAAGMAFYLYRLAKKLSGGFLISVFLGIMFLCSRFAYYDISQLLGLMEALCIFFVLAIAGHLYAYMTEEREWEYYKALIFYFLVSLTHERFMVLLPLFFYVRIIRRSKRWEAYASAGFTFILLQVIRRFTIGTVLPAGTGRTNVVETFTLGSFIRSLAAEIGYMFGINAGPEHLNAIPWEQMPPLVRGFTIVSIFLAMVVFCYYILCLAFLRKHKAAFERSLATAALLILMIGGCLISSAVTIRVEMRWIYAPYALMLLLIAHIYAVILKVMNMKLHAITPDKEMRILLLVPGLVIVFWGIFLLPTEWMTYRAMDKIYLFPNQKRYNSLADETYGKYKDELFGKEIFIVGNSYEMDDFTAKTFFKVYAKEEEEVTVHHIASMQEIGQITPNMIVLKEDPANDRFVDATDIYRDLKCQILEGYYRDGWMDEEAQINVMSGPGGEVTLEFMYPGELNGQQVVNVSVDGGEVQTLDLQENIVYKTFKTKPNAIMNLKFVNDFYFPDAKEQRGERRLSLIVNITTK